MNRKDLAKVLAQKTKLKPDKAERLITAFCNVVEKALSRGDKIIYSNFGTFYTVHYPSKVIFHPKLGKAKQMVMLPTNAVKWMPSGNIKELVNSGAEIENLGTITAHGSRKANQGLIQNSKPTVKPPLENIPAPENIPAKDEDTVEIPIRSSSSKVQPESKTEPQNPTPVNIYEEMLGDGSKMESTFKDTIRVHKDRTKSFIGRMFSRKDSADQNKLAQNENNSRVSLAGAGIFSKNVDSSLPTKTPAAKNKMNDINPQSTAPVETPQIETFKRNDNPFLAALKPEVPIAPITSTFNKAEISYIDLSKTIVPKEILQRIPENLARKYKIVPIDETADQLIMAMADPQDLEAREMIKKIVQKEISPRLSSEEDINHILDQYSGLEKELSEAIKTADESADKETGKSELIESASDNAPAARIVTSLLRRAIRDKASDIHIEPTEKEVLVRLREDGILRKTVTLPKDIQSSVISRIKILSNMKIDEQRLPQDGRFSITVDSRKVDFRVSTLPVANGEKVVMRVLDKLTGILSIEELGIRGTGLVSLKENLKKSHGMILVTGPTGSGKTTSLYALIDNLYSEGVNIVTLEDPIEYRMPGINQSQVNAEIDYTFASGLRTLVRQDPDIIMIGEIRDGETAEMAVHAALTGHIVLSTLHTNDSAGAAPRLLDMGIEPFLLTSSLNIVIAQRLARKICDDCKEELKISDVEIEKIKAEIEKMPAKEKESIKDKPLKFFHGKGCKNCNDRGYKGRIGLYEVLEISEPIKEMILKKESSFQIQEKAISAGMVTMLQDGILKAFDGTTTLEEVWRTTEE